ncbi:MAG: phosphatidylserine decarboxylase [Fusicatenibacter sp.]|nr:phosphatidylserine decarboxylase [Fusicatenibacter sp.]
MSLCSYHDGTIKEERGIQDRVLEVLYGSIAGRLLIRPFLHPAVSRVVGHFLDTGASKILIGPFVKANRIDLSVCEKEKFASYNDFFTRRLRAGERNFSCDSGDFASPCDARLLISPIHSKGHFAVKNTVYTLEELLRDKELSRRYMGGYSFLYRLSVDDYHRYCFVDDGICSPVRRIDGIFHTVNPTANDHCPIYKENTREYSLLRSRNFGTILMMEVGALLVGRIVNHEATSGKREVYRGEEKGYFAFGGSTILILTEKGKVIPDQKMLRNSQLGIETRVFQGETVGKKREPEEIKKTAIQR